MKTPVSGITAKSFATSEVLQLMIGSSMYCCKVNATNTFRSGVAAL
jgi:hypothetical protein